jgi:hypothetical protein
MPDIGKIILLVANGIGCFALLLLLISFATPTWLDGGNGNTVGLFRKCYGSASTNPSSNVTDSCIGESRPTQGGLSIFGFLLLTSSVVVGFAAAFLKRPLLLWISLGLMYFASMFVMSAYATWGTYSREPALYKHPNKVPESDEYHTSMGSSYHLCVASHFFLWTALTVMAFGVGHAFASSQNGGSETN